MPKPSAMPGTVKIGPHNYAIFRQHPALGPEELGHCDTTALELVVKARLKRTKAKEILVHEILHAIVLQSLACDKAYQDEEFIEAVAPLLMQVVLENPELIAFLTS